MNVDFSTQPPLGSPRRIRKVIVVGVTHHQHVNVEWWRSALTGIACRPRSVDVRLVHPFERWKEVGQNRDWTVGQRQQLSERPDEKVIEIRPQQPKVTLAFLYDEARPSQLVSLPAYRRLGNLELVGQFSHRIR